MPWRRMMSNSTQATTMMPMMMLRMATGTSAMVRPFCRMAQTEEPAMTPTSRPVPPRVEMPPMTAAATPYIS